MTEKLKLPLMQNANLKNKVVLIRFDHNVVKKGKIQDAFRIESTFATLFNVIAKGGKPILMTHVGRPKDKKTGEILIDEKTSVQPIINYFKNKLHLNFVCPNLKADGNSGIKNFDSEMDNLKKDLINGEIDGIYLPNTRWFAGEEAKDDTAVDFAKKLSAYADVFINDAFGSWQAHASTALIPDFLPSYTGLLMQKELINLDAIYQPNRPFVAIVAGSKFDTKIETLYTLFDKADYLVLGGVIYNAFIAAKYGFSIKGIDDDDLKYAKEFVAYTEKFPEKLLELPFIVESDSLEGKFEGQYRVHNIHDIKKGTQLNYVLDIAPDSFKDNKVIKTFSDAKLFFVNAVMGLTPFFYEGTVAMNTLIDMNKTALKLFGGGDTLQDFKTFLPGIYMNALDNTSYYMFTGGGAVLKAIQEGNYLGLKPVAAIAQQY